MKRVVGQWDTYSLRLGMLASFPVNSICSVLLSRAMPRLLGPLAQMVMNESINE